MSISRPLWGEKPAAKRPKIEHHEHRFAQHPLSKTLRTDVKFLGGMAEKQTAKSRRKCSRSCIPQERKGGGGARARARARPPLLPGGCPLRVRDSFYILSISTYLSLYTIYIYTHLSLSLSLVSRSKFSKGLGGRTCALRNCNKV